MKAAHVILLCASVAGLAVVLFVHPGSPWSRRIKPVTFTNNTIVLPPKSDEYRKGVNDALMAIAMLDMEQGIYGTNRTWGKMSEIVCQRLHVKYRQPNEFD